MVADTLVARHGIKGRRVPACQSVRWSFSSFAIGKGRTRADRRTVLGGRVLRSGRVVMKPCSACEKSKRTYSISASSESCSECAARGTRCSLFVSNAKWERLEKNRDSLRAQLLAARTETDRLYKEEERIRQEEEASLAREKSLQTRLRFLERREAEFVARDLSSIEELERLEQEESGTIPSSLAEAPQPVVAENSSARNPPAADLVLDPSPVDWARTDPLGFHPWNPVNWLQSGSTAPLNFAALDQTSEGFAGGTAPVSSGSPSGT